MTPTSSQHRATHPCRTGGAELSLFELTMGATLTQGIALACRLEIPDHLADRSLELADLAGLSGRPEPMVHRLLLLLRSVGIVTDDDGAWALTEFGAPLQRSASPSLRGWALMAGAPWFWAPLGRLDECLGDRRSGFDLAYGSEVFDLLADDAFPGAQQVYDDAMGGAVTIDGAALCDIVDLHDRTHVVDVGGGDGSLCLEVLAANPHIEGTVFDRPAVVEARWGREHPAASRCRWHGGDFFDDVPAHGDAYVMSRILHDWDDRRVAQLLDRVRAAMEVDQPLFIIEQLLGEDCRPFTPLCDLNMAVLYGTGERDRSSLTALLESASFSTAGITRLSSGRFLIEARAVSSMGNSGEVAR